MNPIIYLDNAATSYPKPPNVIRAVTDSLFRCGNPGRSSHSLSLYSARAVFDCREAICAFFNFNRPENVVFTYNTTYALNMAIKGLITKGEIVVSNYEHNSVLRPAGELAKERCGVSLSVFNIGKNDEETVANFTEALSEKTSLCVITLCSNVTGRILPYRRISEICKARGIKLIFDAAQYAGLMPLDLSSLYFSAVCFACHKSLCGIMGCGFCIFSPEAEPESIIQGGNGVESASPVQSGPLPERLESGTVGVPGIIALREGLRHIEGVGQREIMQKCSYLENRLSDGLMNISGITVYGRCKNKVSTALFGIDKIPSEQVSSYLSSEGICVRGGLHCAPLAHKALGTLDAGAVRASISHFNSGRDIDIFLSEIQKIAK